MTEKDRSYRGSKPIEIVPGRTHYAADRKFGVAALCGNPWGENLTLDRAKLTCDICIATLARYGARPDRLAQLAPKNFVEERDRFKFKGVLPKKATVAALRRTGNFKET